jgi:hypothetical protein
MHGEQCSTAGNVVDMVTYLRVDRRKRVREK